MLVSILEDLEGLEALRKGRRVERGAELDQMVHFGCEFPHSRHMCPDRVPNSVQRSMARDIDVKRGAPRAPNADESGREVVHRHRRPKGCKPES